MDKAAPGTRRKTETAPLAWHEFEALVAKLVTDVTVRKKVSRCRALMGAALGTFCGMRAGDVLRLRWKELVNRQVLVVQEQKTGKSREIALNVRLQELIAFAYTATGSPSLEQFVMSNERSAGTKPVSMQFYNREIATIFREHGVVTLNASSHTFRKTFGLRVFELNNRNEEALIVLSQIFNHSSIAVTRRYLNLQPERIASVYMSL